MTGSVWLLGHPIKHTLSPAMHRAAYAKLRLDLVYLAADVPPDRLAAALQGLLALGATGVNLTIPHKQAVLEHLHSLTPRARELQAVNCLKPTPEGWIGHNTDADGWLDSWNEEIGESLQGRPVTILGNGGASKALQGLMREHQARVTVLTRHTLRDLRLEPGALVINATPVGTQSDETILSWPEGPRDVIAADLVYNPLETRFLREARQRGFRTLGGLGMLVHQARRAIGWWLGLDDPDCAREMRAAAQSSMKTTG